MGDVVPFRRDPNAPRPIDPGPMSRLQTAPDGDPPPPHDLRAEEAVLCACMLDPVDGKNAKACALTTASDLLRSEHFFAPKSREIWQAIQDLRIARTPIDPVTIKAQLERRGQLGAIGGVTELVRIADASPEIRNVDAHAAIVLEMFERRALIEACRRNALLAYGDAGPWLEHKAKVRAEIGKLTAPRVRRAGALAGQVVEEARDRVRSIQEGVSIGLDWGFRNLAPFGLLGRKRQHVIAGRPGMGKTAFAWQVCVNVAETARDALGVGEAVYFCSWEMPRDLLLFRAACTFAMVDFHHVERGDADAYELERIADQLDRFERLPIVIDDERCTTSELSARVLQRKADFERGAVRDRHGNLLGAHRLGLVAVDYVQLGIDGADKPRADKRSITGATSKGLVENVAKKCDVATLVLAMLRRVEAAADGKVRAPIVDNLKESGEIEEDADTIMLIHRPHYYLRRKCPAELRGVAEMWPGKGRFGMSEDTIPRLGFARGKFSDQLPAAARGEPHYDNDERQDDDGK